MAGVEVSQTGIDWVDRQLKEELNNLQDSKFDKDISIRYLKNLNKNSYKEMMSRNSGATVVAIQVLLKELGYNPGRIDGILKGSRSSTSKTMEAVKAFQRKNNLTPDGLPGPITVNKLLAQFGGGGNGGRGRTVPQQPTNPDTPMQAPEMMTLADLKQIDISKLGKFGPNGFEFNRGMEKSDNKGKYVEITVGGKKKRIYERGNKQNGIYYERGKAYNGSLYLKFAQFKNGQTEGQGTKTLSNGDKYVGQWKNGNFEGQGIMTVSNGNKYVGQFKDDELWTGVHYDKDGKIIEKWENGNKVQ